MVYPFFFLLFFLFYFVSLHLNTVVLVKVSQTLFGLLQSELMIFSAVILSVPKEGSPGADAAPLSLQPLALLAECSQLSVVTKVQFQVRSQALQLLGALTRVVVDHFSLLLCYKSLNRVQPRDKDYLLISQHLKLDIIQLQLDLITLYLQLIHNI